MGLAATTRLKIEDNMCVAGESLKVETGNFASLCTALLGKIQLLKHINLGETIFIC